MGWNCINHPQDERIIRLSVSSLGSNGVKQQCWSSNKCHSKTFSILSWIEWGETQPITHWRCWWKSLSVSSLGSNGVKHASRADIDASNSHFQYPLLDRMGWNLHPTKIIRWGYCLSVSSLGSNGVKLHASWINSIYRVLSVSSLGSNGVKLLRCYPHIAAHLIFQYPLLDRMGWNWPGWQDGAFFQHLSVSSLGSNGVKRRQRLVAITTIVLSVSSLGSNGVKQERN